MAPWTLINQLISHCPLSEGSPHCWLLHGWGDNNLLFQFKAQSCGPDPWPQGPAGCMCCLQGAGRMLSGGWHTGVELCSAGSTVLCLWGRRQKALTCCWASVIWAGKKHGGEREKNQWVISLVNSFGANWKVIPHYAFLAVAGLWRWLIVKHKLSHALLFCRLHFCSDLKDRTFNQTRIWLFALYFFSFPAMYFQKF